MSLTVQDLHFGTIPKDTPRLWIFYASFDSSNEAEFENIQASLRVEVPPL